MKCDKAQEFFSDYIEDTLDRPMTVALESHLSGCETCKADVASLRGLFTVLDKVPQVEPPADFVWRTTTRLQNEMLNRREAEQAKPLPWWKRLTPVQTFTYAGIAALLAVGLAFPVNTIMTQTWGIDLFKHTVPAPPPPPAPVVTAPQFSVQVPGQNSYAATVTITATSDIPSPSVAMGGMYAVPNQGLRGSWTVIDRKPAKYAGQGWTVPIQAGGAHAFQVKVMTPERGGVREFAKVLLLPGTEAPVMSLQAADPYFALQQVANLTGQPMLVDGGLKQPVTLELQNLTQQQAMEQVLAAASARSTGLVNGVLMVSAR
jgi:hypothetical protein